MAMNVDVASAIGLQMEQMIRQAKVDSETRVARELNQAKARLKMMDSTVVELTDRVARVVRQSGGVQDHSQTVDQKYLAKTVQQLETKWCQEVKALKQDLHRTILAHNHNSDLMRHHRHALDEAKSKVDAMSQSRADPQNLEKVERALRGGQAQARALDAFAERLAGLESQVGEMLPAYHPGMPGTAGGHEPKAAQPKKKAAAKEDEIRARLLAARAAQDSVMSFNAEAPVFVPRGAGHPVRSLAATAGDSKEASPESAGAAAAETTAEDGVANSDDDAVDATEG